VSDDDLYWTLVDIANGLLSGTMLGGFYAITALGLALTFGVMRLVNLAHGDWLIFAAYLAMVGLSLVPVSPFWTLLLVVPVMFVIGFGVQYLLLNGVSVQAMELKGLSGGFGVMSPVLVTFGMSIVLSHSLLAWFSSDTVIIQNSFSYSAIHLSEDLGVSMLRLVFFLVAVAIMIGMHLFLRVTHIGRAIRAAADDAEIAPLMGMRVAPLYAVASGLSFAVAGVAGVMIGMSRPFHPFDGPPFLLIAFGVVIVGGLDSVIGTLIGGMLLGIVQVLAGTYFGPSAQLIAGYMLILMVLAFRPQGLFGR
jgi:branched-chain amino acid transport system permease protein